MRVLKKSNFLLVWLLLSFSSLCFSQQYTIRDQAEIAYQAQLTLSMYKDLLNVIAYEGLATESEIKELIRNSYSNSKTQIFYSDEAIIEDDIKPSNLKSGLEQDKSIKNYLNYFDLAYVKSDEETIDFYDFQPSNLKYRDFLYIKVKFSSLFKGKHKEDKTPYKAVDRLAEFRVEKRNNEWKTYITSIVFYNPENPISSTEGDVELDRTVAEDGTFSHLRGKINQGNDGPGENTGMESFSAQTEEQDSIFNHHMLIGKAALAAEKLDEAFVAFSEAERIYPFHRELRQNLMELTKAQNLQISSAENRYEYAKLHAERAMAARDYVRAKALYSQAFRLNPKEESLKGVIEKLEKTIQKTALPESKFAVGEYKEAIKDYNKAIKEEENNPDYYYGRGKCYEKLNSYKEAFRDYSKAIELDGNFIEARSSKARLYTETKQFHEAVADYTLILSNPDYAPEFYPERARVKEMMGDMAGALEDYNSAIRLSPGVADHDFQKGLILISMKKPEQAISSFSEAIRKDFNYAGAYYQRGLAYAAIGNVEAAAPDLARARELGIEEAQLKEIQKLALQYHSKGEEQMGKENYKAALHAFEDALRIYPEFGRAWLRKGDGYYNLEDYESALNNYHNAVKFDSVSFAYFKRGLTYQKIQNEELAQQDFERYASIGQEVVRKAEEGERKISSSEFSLTNFVEERADAWYALGYAQLMNEEYIESLENLDNAISIRKFFPRAYFARGSALYALEDYKRAVKDMEESIKQGLSDPFVFYSLGRAYMANDQVEDAILSLTHTLKLDEQYEDAYKERAVCYRSIGEYKLALEDVNAALSLNEELEKNASLMTLKGMLELYQNNIGEARDSFDQALRLNENEAWALYGKACTLAREQKIKESLELYRRAFETKQIEWSAIKNDSLLAPINSDKDFKKLVKTYF